MTDIDFQQLDSRQFELLCGALLAAEGFQQLRRPYASGVPDHGVDWEFDGPHGERLVAQVKLLRHRLSSPSILRQIVGDLQRGMALRGADKAFLILSASLDSRSRNELSISTNIEIWDEPKIQSLLAQHTQVLMTLERVIDAQEALDNLSRVKEEREGTEVNRLIADLDAVSPGREDASRYEEVCVRILNYAFSPSLRPPKIQKWSEDGLDRRDAVFPLRTGNRFWDSVKYEYLSRLVVAEFKNYSDQIAQAEVEAIQQYLFPKARRAFGLLCSRQAPSISAVKARRRAWMLSGVLIIFLSDGDLKDVVRMKAQGEDAEAVLEAQMDDFFLQLAP